MRDEDTLVVWIFGAICMIVTVGSFFIGWVIAHSTVARECERLNGFYVGNEVYECKAKGLK